ncbi:sterol-4-alpha-carboxylate 3-dehydrogenase, decarboxylating-like [Orbicella faveolata]|uniref:sterol-4-alpha-carboxylate 3-dehydrogenase, decarboxylating-like n=1 Tax=Orbicella faveolata TaxID=48498 RepID=UPI0009E19E37|nr:sterol-4-alpha-carboxylate 3-dehydrogenase, decarboxylating-like [Orbicella faveolata]XP_020601662.1 sterol-4-alpha-carboxylate 3-dehydrogenase, decarboxylating-like [Orbicella faveolata]
MASKPSVLVLGGLGFVGRNLVCYLVEHDLCSKIRAVDKVPPQTAWLNERHKEAFKHSSVEFRSANLINPVSVEKAFLDADGDFDVCINCAAETRYGQSEEVYADGVFKLSMNCAKQAVKCNVKRYIEISTAQVYSCDKGVSDEESRTSPWTYIAKYKLMVEEELSKLDGLNYVIGRPAVIYGLADRQGLTPRLIIGAVYKQMEEKMKLLWTKDLKMSTVHVTDVCRALWHLTSHGKSGDVFNLADKGDSTQGSITNFVCEIFGIQHDYFGTVLSNMARLNMASTVEDSNEKHLAPWSAACERDGIHTTPLSPYLDQELLYDNHLCINGSKLEQSGFSYNYPELTVEGLREVLDDYVQTGQFPPSLAQPR